MMDNYDLWEAHDRKQEAARSKCPVCSYCGRHIQEERLFDIDRELYHMECAEKEFCKYTEDYEN